MMPRKNKGSPSHQSRSTLASGVAAPLGRLTANVMHHYPSYQRTKNMAVNSATVCSVPMLGNARPSGILGYSPSRQRLHLVAFVAAQDASSVCGKCLYPAPNRFESIGFAQQACVVPSVVRGHTVHAPFLPGSPAPAYARSRVVAPFLARSNQMMHNHPLQATRYQRPSRFQPSRLARA